VGLFSKEKMKEKKISKEKKEASYKKQKEASDEVNKHKQSI